VTFELPSDPWVERVNLAGELNDWDIRSTPMIRELGCLLNLGRVSNCFPGWPRRTGCRGIGQGSTTIRPPCSWEPYSAIHHIFSKRPTENVLGDPNKKRSLVASFKPRVCPMTPGCEFAILGPITLEDVQNMSIQKGIVAIAAFLIGVAIGVLLSWAVGLADDAQTQVLEGYAWVNEAGTAIGLSPDGEMPGASYVVAGALARMRGAL
jgi:hypothetical protein